LGFWIGLHVACCVGGGGIYDLRFAICAVFGVGAGVADCELRES
jgi:hypothetical protein